MMIILKSNWIEVLLVVLLSGGMVHAQDGPVRKPIPEVPNSDTAKPEPPAGESSRSPEERPSEEVIDIKDTLFAPAQPGDSIDEGEIPYSAPDEPVDASTMQVAAVAPKDDQLELMQLYEGLRQFDNGIAAANLVLKRDPKNKEALAGMTRLMVETGRSTEALEYSGQLLELDPGVRSQALRASALMSDAQVEEAESLLLDMKARHEGDAPFQYETLLGFAKLDQGQKAEARAIFEAVENGDGYVALEVDTASKQLLLMDLDRAVEWRDVGKAKELVARLRDGYAGEPETAAAEAVELFLDGSAGEATARLSALRSDFPRLRLYPFILQLADFSYVAGDFGGAEAAYAEALDDRRTRPRDREAAVRNRAQMRVREGGHLLGDIGIVNGEEGTLVTSRAKARRAVGENWYFGGEFTRQDVDLDGLSVVKDGDDRMEGLLTAERRLKKGRFAEGRIGGSDAGVMGSVTIGKRARVYSDAWAVGVAANMRANDSAQLVSLDGRQYRITALFQHEINPRTVVTAGAFARQVQIDGDELGNGAGGEIDLAFRLNEEERRSNYFVAWRSTYAKFDRSSSWRPRGKAYDAAVIDQMTTDEVAAALVEPEYSVHGVEVRHEGQWQEVLFTRAMAGIYYRADNSDVQATAGFGLDWFFRENWRLFFDALYTSNGKAGNIDGGVFEAKTGLAKNF